MSTLRRIWPIRAPNKTLLREHRIDQATAESLPKKAEEAERERERLFLTLTLTFTSEKAAALASASTLRTERSISDKVKPAQHSLLLEGFVRSYY